MAAVNPQEADGLPDQRLVIVSSEVIARAAELPVVRDLTVTRIGQGPAAPGQFVRRPKGVAEWVMLCCFAGVGAVDAGDGRRELTAGDVTIVPPRVPHVYEADLFTPWSLGWVHFTGERAADHVAALGWTAAEPVLHVPDAGALPPAFERLHELARHGCPDCDLLEMTASFAGLLGRLRASARSRDPRTRRTEERVLAVLEELRAAPERRWTVEEMARHAGLSETHFHDLFRQHTGSPPLSFLIRLRLQRACEILAHEAETVERTAHRVGYEDADHFSALFRRHLGVLPSKFRREPRGDE